MISRVAVQRLLLFGGWFGLSLGFGYVTQEALWQAFRNFSLAFWGLFLLLSLPEYIRRRRARLRALHAWREFQARGLVSFTPGPVVQATPRLNPKRPPR